MRTRSQIDCFAIGVFGLAVIATFGMWKSSGESLPELLRGNPVAPLLEPWHAAHPIVFNVSVGYIASFTLWILVVWLPDRRRRAILRNNLRSHYQSFREEVIYILLCAVDRSGAVDLELPKQLTNHEKFREYFSKNQYKNWYAALNGLQAYPKFLEDLILETDVLANEVAFILAKVQFDDPETMAFFKRLSHFVQRLKNASVYSDDQVEYFGNFVWELLARWSIIEGQRKDDIVETMISRI